MKDTNIFKADATTNIEEQITGGCFSVPFAAISLLFLILGVFAYIM